MAALKKNVEDYPESLQAAGYHLLYLPRYSPDLNPIEHKWAEAKAIRRKHQCSIEDLFKNVT